MSSSKHQQEIHEHHIQSDITNHLKVTLSQDGNQQPSLSLENNQQSAFCAPITLPPRKSLSMCFTSNGKALPLPPKKKDIYRPYILQSCEIRTSVEEDLSAAQAILDLSASPAAPSHSVFMHTLSSSPLSDLQSQPITMPQQPITIQTSIGVQSVSMNNNSFQRLPKILDTTDGSLSNSTAESRTNVYDNNATSITIPTFTNSSKTIAYTYEAFFVSDGRSKKRSNNVTIPEKEINTACKRTKFTCTECGKQYATSSNLSRHKQTHRSLDSQSAKKCIHCGKAYVSMPALAMHVLTHKLAYTCGICGKMFSRPWLLQGHLRSHTGEKPYGCAHCGKAFADRSNLRAHMQTHSSDKHYECSRCHKTFALKSYLNKHLESACPKDGDVSTTQSNTDREKTPTYDQQQYDPVHNYRCL